MYTRILEFDVQQARAGLAAGDGVLLAARDEGHVLWGPLTYLSQLRRKERRLGSPKRCTAAAGRAA